MGARAKVVIVGAGEVGSHLSQLLSDRGEDVVVIESSYDRQARLKDEFNVRVIEGNGASASVLKEAQVDSCDFFLAMTSDDRTNILAASLAKVLGARTTIARIHDQTYSDTSHINYQLHFGIDLLINPEGLCAVELAKDIRSAGRVAVENFARGQIEVQQVKVMERSKLVGRNLRELKLPSQVRVGYVERPDYADVPSADTVIEEGDLLTIFGPQEGVEEMRKRIQPSLSRESRSVVIYGGGETAIGLIRLLNSPRYNIRVLDKDAKTCQILAARFPRITVIHGDGTSLRLLEEENVGAADYFISTTKDDEDNIVTGIQASKLGARHVQTVINKTDYEMVLEDLRSSLGLESIVSPRIASANEVLRYLSRDNYVVLARYPSGTAVILEMRVPLHSPVAGKALKEISWPRHMVVVAILHKFHARVPGADDTILQGDRIVVITRESNIRELEKLVGA